MSHALSYAVLRLCSLAVRNKCDSSDRRNEWCESTVWSSSGREFQIAGPHTKNAFFPNCFLVRWTTAALVDDDSRLNRWAEMGSTYTKRRNKGIELRRGPGALR